MGNLSLCSNGRNAWISVDILKKSDRTCLATTDSTSFLSHTFILVYNKCAHDFWCDLHMHGESTFTLWLTNVCEGQQEPKDNFNILNGSDHQPII
jgi:hypothetical protein